MMFVVVILWILLSYIDNNFENMCTNVYNSENFEKESNRKMFLGVAVLAKNDGIEYCTVRLCIQCF